MWHQGKDRHGEWHAIDLSTGTTLCGQPRAILGRVSHWIGYKTTHSHSCEQCNEQIDKRSNP
jgi:hypothetical protein